MRPLALAILIAAPLAAPAAGVVPPAPSRYVTDGSGVLPPDRAAALERKLADFERQTSTQVLVWIAPRVPEGTTAEELGADAIRAWGVGQKGKDNGAVLFLFTEDRALRLATGYGLEGAIPDVRAKRVLRDVVKPHLQRGDVPAGIEAGVDEILRLARGEGFEGTGSTVAEEEGRAGMWWFILAEAGIVAAILAFVFLRGRPRPAAISFLVGGFGTFLWFGDVLPAGVGLAFLALTAGAIAISVVLSKRGGNGWEPSSSSSSDWSSSSSSFDSSSSSSSDSGFSGGGGDSGGGGASETY